MEISSIGGMAQPVPQKQIKSCRVRGMGPNMLPRGGRDTVEISRADVARAEKYGFITRDGERIQVSDEMTQKLRQARELADARNQAGQARREMEELRKNAEAASEGAAEEGKSMLRAITIMRRIAKGGIVPPEDERFLMEFSKEMYMVAKNEAMLAKEHEKYDSVLDDEDEAERESAAVESSTGEGYGVEAAVSESGEAAAESE